jgi:hypothetical protein
MEIKGLFDSFHRTCYRGSGRKGLLEPYYIPCERVSACRLALRVCCCAQRCCELSVQRACFWFCSVILEAKGNRNAEDLEKRPAVQEEIRNLESSGTLYDGNLDSWSLSCQISSSLRSVLRIYAVSGGACYT